MFSLSPPFPRRFIFRATVALIPTLLIAYARAQNYSYTPGYPLAPPVSPQIAPAPAYTPDQLDQMLAPIALYPDPLLSEVLAACTYPQDVAAAAQWLQYHPQPSEQDINSQPWDPSAKALVHYPTVLQMLAGQMDWTEALGSAFANHPQDVMDSVQRIRAKAQAENLLQTTPQQEIVQDNGVIEILPAQPDVIYVPQYNPEYIYAPPPYYDGWLTFGPAFSAGLWLNLGWDWHNHYIDRGFHWDHDWHHPVFDHREHWEHDIHRPIPVPAHPFIPPHGPENHRGWGTPGNPPGAFDRNLAPRPPATPRNPGDFHGRPVTNLPPIRPSPSPQRLTPAPAPVIPHTPTPRPAPAPSRINTPGPSRPVTGLPPRAPPPSAPPPPRPAPAPQGSSQLYNTFHPGFGGGGASARGHESMHR